MPWNWELPEWPKFSFDPERIASQERQFLMQAGSADAFLKNISTQESHQFVVEILSQEGEESSRIEGEILDRESLQSSIKKHFGLQAEQKRAPKKEAGMAMLLCDVYESFQDPLSHEMLWKWHGELFLGSSDIANQYRTHVEPMQIVSHPNDSAETQSFRSGRKRCSLFLIFTYSKIYHIFFGESNGIKLSPVLGFFPALIS